jgi:hypothetical protein
VTNPSRDSAVATRWTREQIRAARLAPLLPLLEKRGLTLVETGGGNFAVREHPGLAVKDSYWRWPEHGLQGNAIDFCTQVLRLSFHQAMRELTAS